MLRRRQRRGETLDATEGTPHDDGTRTANPRALLTADDTAAPTSPSSTSLPPAAGARPASDPSERCRCAGAPRLARCPPPPPRRPPPAGRGRLGGAQPRDEHLEQGPRDLRVLLDERAELALRDAPAAHVRLRRDVGRAPAAVDQRDLAEEVVAAQARDRVAGRADRRLALGDDEEAGAARAAARDRRAGVVHALAEARRERDEVVVAQAGEQRHAAEKFDRNAHASPRTIPGCAS